MADKKISQLTALSAANVASATDVLAIVDTSATETKKITAKDLIDGALNGGTANGVLYLNGSKVATSGSALVFDGTNLGIGTASPSAKLTVFAGADGNIGFFRGGGIRQLQFGTSSTAGYLNVDNATSGFELRLNGTAQAYLDSSGNLGLGVTPSAWFTDYRVMQVGLAGAVFNDNFNEDLNVSSNSYADTRGGYKFIRTGYAQRYTQTNSGQHQWRISTASGTAGNAISYTQAMTLDASGNLLVGTTATTSGARLDVKGVDSTGSNYCVFFENSGSALLVAVQNDGRWRSGTAAASPYNYVVGSTNRDLFVDNGGDIGYVSSVRASKTNIAPDVDTDWLLQLNPVTFNFRKKDADGNYTDEADGPIKHGLIAEEVEQVNADLCFYDDADKGGALRGVNYSHLITPMLKLIQKQQAAIAVLEAKVSALEAK